MAPFDDTGYAVPADTETEAEPFTLDHMIAWMRTKPADEVYCFQSIDHCLLAQYGKALGYRCMAGANYISIMTETGLYSSNRVIFPVKALIASGRPRTFGAALDRAIAYRDGLNRRGME